MARQKLSWLMLFMLAWALVPTSDWAQSFRGSISGTVTDPSGAVVPNAELTVKSVDHGVEVGRFTTGSDGIYYFGNLAQGNYQVEASAKGFRDFVQRGVTINVNQAVTLNVRLEVGSPVQKVEVQANASPLNFRNAEIKQAVPTRAIDDLPLQVAGGPRIAANFVLLVPGVTSSGGNAAWGARVNGGQNGSDEALIDGVTMQEGVSGTSGLKALAADHPVIPEEVSEVSVLTSNYEPQYGGSNSSVITMVTKSGTNEFHGDAHEYLRNTVLNARQFGGGTRPKDIENEFGGSIGGPVKVPGISSGKRKTFFYFTYDRWVTRGALVTQFFSLPPLQERQGDFRDWVDSKGNLIPVFDPATTRPDPNNPGKLIRDQFMGCDGKTPNVICPSDPRLQNSLAKAWFKFMPAPNLPGLRRNFVSPTSRRGLDHRLAWAFKIDHYMGDKDHFAASVHLHGTVNVVNESLPLQITRFRFFETPPIWTDRLSWDHTFSPTLLNTVNFGYSDQPGAGRCLDAPFVKDLPQIPGVDNSGRGPPSLGFDDFFSEIGCGGFFESFKTLNYSVTDLATKVWGKHTVKFGGEYRALEWNEASQRFPFASGSFNFSFLNTGLLGLQSGSPIASFLLEQVDAGGSKYLPTIDQLRSKFFAFHAGDTWKATSKFSVNYGLRWDHSTPFVDKFDRYSFLDPVGSNPGAGGRPGRLAFAGTSYGAASFGKRHPEDTWYGGFTPRLGLAYAWNDKTVVRAGYGLSLALAANWPFGNFNDGFSLGRFVSGSNGGLTPAFTLRDGIPQNFQKPPFIDSTFDNGQSGPQYRGVDSMRSPYTQQWNLTIERQFTKDFYISAGYVGSKGTRLYSAKNPLNAIDPKFLSMGQKLFDQFKPGQTVLDGVPVPYAGWAAQMTCSPNVAQALRPFPQYCSSFFGATENAGNSSYHSFQFKAEKRYSRGTWLLASYTISKLISDSDPTGSPEPLVFQGTQGAISRFEQHRNKSLSVEDIPQTLSLAFVYELPFGQGERFLNKGGLVNKLAGGWAISNIFRAQAGVPFFFRVRNQCNVPGQFVAGCIPAILPGANPFLQDPGSFDPGKGPLFNKAAFENPNNFSFYLGQGPRVSNARAQGFHNQDIALLKNTKITERVGVQFRAEFFNLWNWHMFNCQGLCFASYPFSINVDAPDFGVWNGGVTNPRQIQFGLKVVF